MPDTIDIIAEILEELGGSCSFVGSPKIIELCDFDFKRHKAQNSDILGVSTEFVYQYSNGMSEVDHSGTIAYPIAGKMFALDFSS